MKSLLLGSLLAAATILAFGADSASLNGKWKVHTAIAGNESDSECSFTQTGNDLAGACSNDQGSHKLTGKVDGSKITWSYGSEYNGEALTLRYSGTLDEATAKISGSVTVDPFGVDGDFTATPSK